MSKILLFVDTVRFL